MKQDRKPRTNSKTVAISAPPAGPACYFPLKTGVYEIMPGLFPLSEGFGNGAIDQQIFQIDDQFGHYHLAKSSARRENVSKYFQTSDFPDERRPDLCLHKLASTT